VSFFDPPAPPPEPPEPSTQPEWAGAPNHVIGVATGIRIVAARTGDVAVLVDHVIAYPTGIEFDVSVIRRRSHDPYDNPFDLHWRRQRGQMTELPPELFRFGVEFSDGRRATSIRGNWPEAGEAPDMVLLQGRGGGGALRYTFEYWLWPLPPPGPLAFVAEWPAQGIELTRAEVDAGLIREAAARAEVLWEPERASRGGGWAAYGPLLPLSRDPHEPPEDK